MAGGGKGGLWKAQRVPAEPWHMGQYGYNQVTPLPPAHLSLQLCLSLYCIYPNRVTVLVRVPSL